MAIEFRQKLKFFKISHNHGQNLLRQLAKIEIFENRFALVSSFNKIYSLTVGILNFQKDESKSSASEKT